MFKDHEKFWAFLSLLAALVWLSWMSQGQDQFVMVDGKPVSIAGNNPLRDAIVGIIGILGVAAQALFRVNELAKDMNELLKSTVEKLGDSIPTIDRRKKVPEDVQEAADQVAGAAAEEAAAISDATETQTGSDATGNITESEPRPDPTK